MPHRSATLFNPGLPGLFADSVPGLYLDEMAGEVFGYGRILHLAPGAALEAPPRRSLTIVLDGRLAGPQGWFGPGNHFEAAGATGLAAMDVPARLWQLDLTATEWLAQGNRPARLALVRALIAADAAQLAATPPADLPPSDSLCDHDHPEIRRRAARLRRASPASTAEAILKFVQPMPYRFGHWQERASDTLARGLGMCTTKANLQVALMRAAGLEAGFARGPMPMAVLGKLMPEGWQALQRPMVKHYFAVVRLGGRWHATDSSFDDGAYGIYASHFPEGAGQRFPTLAEGQPYAPALQAAGLGPWDFTLLPHLTVEMGKKSRFGPAHFEALNTRLDRVRGVQRSRIAEAGWQDEQAGIDGEARA